MTVNTGVRALVPTGYGLNCEAETAAALASLGVSVQQRHVADVLEAGAAALDGVHLVVFVGGFSFGDHIASGRVFANRLRFRMGEHLLKFVDGGGLVLGICNGFQTLVKLGLLPGLVRGRLEQRVSLVANDRLGYWDAWVRLAVDPDSPCVFTRGLPPVIELPSRHGEGKLVYESAALRQELEDRRLVPVRYAGADGRPTERWPDNPDGSPGGAAGLCDPSGRLFGLMPHPEAYLYPENHPRWIAQREAGTLPEAGPGLQLIAAGVRSIGA
jgi:phosphoribosylformylglycinamidine (FGAM) synthase-like amidotransferase family enzyme